MNKKNRLIRSPRIFSFKTTIICLTLVVLFLALAPPILATTPDQFGLDYGTYTGLSTQDIRVTIMNIVRVILGFVGIIAILIIIYAGYLWMTSAGNPEQIDKAKKTLRNAAIGLVIIFSAFSIVSFIIGMLEGGLASRAIRADRHHQTAAMAVNIWAAALLKVFTQRHWPRT